MSSLLEGLRHRTSRAICSNCNRQPPGTFAGMEILHSNPCVQLLCFSLRTAMGSLSFISSVLFTEEGDENDTRRKKLKTYINERQLNYNSKMKETRKRGPKFHVDEHVSIKIDPVDKMSALHPNVWIGKITEVENDYAKIMTKFGRLKTYISTKRLN